MDHLAVAGAGFHADMIVLFQDDGVVPVQGEPARHRQPDGAGANDHCLGFKAFHRRFLP